MSAEIVEDPTALANVLRDFRPREEFSGHTGAFPCEFVSTIQECENDPASVDLLKQSSESLAGRIAYLELGPLDVLEVDPQRADDMWARGGFPRSLLAPDDTASAAWRASFITTYLERDIPLLGPRIAAETLRRLWTMLAHRQGALPNASELARSLGVDSETVAAHIDLMVDLVLDLPGHRRWVVEVKRGAVAGLGKGFHSARADLRPERAFVVYSGQDRFPKAGGIEAIGLGELAAELASLGH